MRWITIAALGLSGLVGCGDIVPITPAAAAASDGGARGIFVTANTEPDAAVEPPADASPPAPDAGKAGHAAKGCGNGDCAGDKSCQSTPCDD